MDCVELCPVDCFYEGENMLVIHPDECIDCGVCEPECPVDAIKADSAARVIDAAYDTLPASTPKRRATIDTCSRPVPSGRLFPSYDALASSTFGKRRTSFSPLGPLHDCHSR